MNLLTSAELAVLRAQFREAVAKGDALVLAMVVEVLFSQAQRGADVAAQTAKYFKELNQLRVSP